MKLKNTASIAVTAGLCLSMALGGAPTAAFAANGDDSDAEGIELASHGWRYTSYEFTFQTEDGTFVGAGSDEFCSDKDASKAISRFLPEGYTYVTHKICQGEYGLYRKVEVVVKKDVPRETVVHVHYYDEDAQTVVSSHDKQVAVDGTYGDIFDEVPAGYVAEGRVVIGDPVAGNEVNSGSTVTPNADIYVHIKRQDSKPIDPTPEPETHEVQVRYFDREAGTAGEFLVDYDKTVEVKNDKSQTYGDVMSIPEGYEFEGTIKANDADVTEGTPVTPEVSYVVFYVTKKAEPVSKVTVTFVDKFNNTKDSVQVEKGQTVAQVEDPSFDGWEFAGWSTDAEKYVAYDFDTPVTEDLVLYASYVKAEDGEGEESVQPETNSDDQKKDEAKEDEQALPQTGDNSAAVVAGVAAAGVAIAAAGVMLKRRQNN